MATRCSSHGKLTQASEEKSGWCEKIMWGNLLSLTENVVYGSDLMEEKEPGCHKVCELRIVSRCWKWPLKRQLFYSNWKMAGGAGRQEESDTGWGGLAHWHPYLVSPGSFVPSACCPISSPSSHSAPTASLPQTSHDLSCFYTSLPLIHMMPHSSNWDQGPVRTLNFILGKASWDFMRMF